MVTWEPLTEQKLLPTSLLILYFRCPLKKRLSFLQWIQMSLFKVVCPKGLLWKEMMFHSFSNFQGISEFKSRMNEQANGWMNGWMVPQLYNKVSLMTFLLPSTLSVRMVLDVDLSVQPLKTGRKKWLLCHEWAVLIAELTMWWMVDPVFPDALASWIHC